MNSQSCMRLSSSWRIHLRTATELQDLAAWINPIVRGWMTYYGRYYRTALNRLLKRINTYLVRWAQRKYKRLRPFRKALRWWTRLTERQPRMFAHWAWMLLSAYLSGHGSLINGNALS